MRRERRRLHDALGSTWTLGRLAQALHEIFTGRVDRDGSVPGYAPSFGPFDHRRARRRRRRRARRRRAALRPGRVRALHLRPQPGAADAGAEPGEPDRRRRRAARRRAVRAAGHPRHRQPPLPVGLRPRAQRPAGGRERRAHVPVAGLRADDLRARRPTTTGACRSSRARRSACPAPTRCASRSPRRSPATRRRSPAFATSRRSRSTTTCTCRRATTRSARRSCRPIPYGLDTEGIQRDPRDGSLLAQRRVPPVDRAPRPPRRDAPAHRPDRQRRAGHRRDRRDRPAVELLRRRRRSPPCRSCCRASGRRGARTAASRASRCRPTARSSTR